MLRRWLKPRYLVPAAFAFAGLHALCILSTRTYNIAISYPFMMLAPWLACAACFWRIRTSSSRTRPAWIMIFAGMLLWACGMVCAAWADLSQYFSQTGAYYPDFIYFLYGVPILLAISLPLEGERIPLFLWLDGIQALMTACLIYVLLFSVLPFMGQRIQPIPVSLMSRTFNIENLVLVCGAVLRVLAQARGGEARHLYRTLAVFLCLYAFCAVVYNHMDVALDEQTGLYDLLVIVPFLFLVVAALLPVAQEPDGPVAADSRPFSLFIDNASPIFYTLTLLALGVINLRRHFSLGIVALGGAVAVYALRSTLLQSRYMRAQRALLEARDELEKLSLQDGLTRVANRRCFDQRLELEWNRANRTQRPLSLLLIDVDYFKSLNDKHGHRYGDQCLIEIAEALRAALPRSSDLLARYGGEEFAAILGATDREGAEVVAVRMQASVGELQILHETPVGQAVTISIGAATREFPLGGSWPDLVEAADRALYQAKRNGRNRVEYFSPDALPAGG